MEQHTPQQPMAAAPIFHFQGLSAAEAIRCGQAAEAMRSIANAEIRKDPCGLVPPRHAISPYSKNRNNNKVWMICQSIQKNIGQTYKHE